MKALKGDGAKTKGGTPGGETGPLFPRLHINETEKAGPRAPPRNKMALYEQFTIPYNRFVPSIQTAVASPYQKQHGSNECQYYLPSTLAYANTSHEVRTYVKPSYGTSNGSLSSCSAVVTEDDFQRVPGPQSVEDLEVPNSGTSFGTSRNPRGRVLEKKSKDDNDFHFTGLSPHGQVCGRSVFTMPGSPHERYDSSMVNSAGAETPRIIGNLQQEASTAYENLFSGSQSCGPASGESGEADGNTGVTNRVQSDRLAQETAGIGFDEHDPSTCSRRQSGQQSVVSNAGALRKLGIVNQGDMPNILSIADVKTPSQCASTYDDSKSSMLGPFLAPSIKPKDVIHAVGQQEFWKARKAILRQQRIFSNQVFELHKLIKVQQLLAETPSTLIDEHMYLGAASGILGSDSSPDEGDPDEQESLADEEAQTPVSVEECEGQVLGAGVQPRLLAENPSTLIDKHMYLGAASSMLGSDSSPDEGDPDEQESLADEEAQTPVSVDECEGQVLGAVQPRFTPFEECEGQVLGAGVQPRFTPQNPGWDQVVNNSPFGQSYPYFTPDGTSAWGYPMGPMTRPFTYQPCAGSFPPGSPFGGVYGSAALGPMQPMVSFSFPSKQWHSGMCQNPPLWPMANDWYAMQHNHMNYRFASGIGKAVTTVSVASINKQAGASTHCVKTAVVPGMQHEWGTSSCTRQVDTSSLGSNATAWASTPSNALSKKAGHGHMDEAPSLDLGGGYRSEDGAKFGGEMEADTKAMTCLKGQKERGRLPTSSRVREDGMGVDLSPHCAVNALNLFPLLPSTSLEGCGGQRLSRQAEEWQGQVIKVVPRPAIAASESAAGILLSIQQGR